MEWQRDVSESDATEFVEGIKLDIFQDQVFVFTPRGDIKDLPAGATPLDFAYRIHTDIGHRTIGAKVNNRLVPLDYRLKNGDIVEIVTTKGEHGPSRDWLNLVRTSHAREKIRQWFKKKDRAENIIHGRESLERELRRLARTSVQAVGLERVAEVAKGYQHETIDDFFAAIGYGAISAQQVVMRLGVLDDGATTLPTIAPQQPARAGGVRVKGVGDLLVRFAKCCHPIPGDPIQGFITRGKGITVHLRSCPTVLNEREVSRLIDVEWEAAPAQTYPIAIRVEAYDRTGPPVRHHPGHGREQGQHPRGERRRQPGPHRRGDDDDPGRVGRAAGQGHEPRGAAEGRAQRPARPRLSARPVPRGDAFARAIECTLVTRGRTSGEPRPITIWFAAVGRTVYLLSGGGEAAHWVRNLRADPAVDDRSRAGSGSRARSRASLDEAEDPVAREAIAAKYGTTGLKTWLRTSLPVAIDLADAPAGEASG